MDLDSLLSNLYQNDATSGALEKTAEATLLNQLRASDQVVEENPFEKLSNEELLKLASEHLGDEVAPAEQEQEADVDLEKTAFDMLGGQIMAHAMIHEFGLIKEAMLNGACRVCKENWLDVEGSSICSTCSSEE